MISHGQRVQVRMCSRKMRYADKYTADVEIAVLKSKGIEHLERVRAYSCPYCDGWHIGHVRKGKRVYR